MFIFLRHYKKRKHKKLKAANTYNHNVRLQLFSYSFYSVIHASNYIYG